MKSLWPQLSSFLRPLGWIYGRFMLWRRKAYRYGLLPSYRPRARVISVGNLTLGGEGKTPLVIWLAERLRHRFRVAILTRGYGGRKKGPLVVSRGEGPLFEPVDIGDETYLLALKTRVPVMLARDRVAGAFWVQKEFETEIIILDDGFQHLRLERDLDLVLFSAGTDPRKLRIFPAGHLREPPQVLQAASAFLVTKTNLEVENLALLSWLKTFDKPLFRVPYQVGEPYPLGGEEVKPPEKKVVAFCGLAKPEGFFQALEQMGYFLAERVVFPDHYRYREKDLERLSSLRRIHQAALATTEKDAVKLLSFVEELAPCYVFPLFPSPGEDLEKFILERLAL